jgi:beta-xylosidase
VPYHRVDFHKFWFDKNDKKKGIRKELERNNNFILRGLYWMSKELYYDDPEFKRSIEPEAQEIAKIRNYIEHKSFIVGAPRISDEFSYFITEENLETKATRLLSLARECIMYVPFAIYKESLLKEDAFKHPN